MQKLLIDTDTASDDAVAILMALRYPANVRVEAITTVFGNVPLKQASINARYTVEVCGRAIPVHEGCARPMLRETAHAEFFHGADGMGNMNYPAPKLRARPEHAVDVIIDTIKRNENDITLVTLGPLTNIATALIKAPEIASMVTRCIVMGGAANTVGNVTPAAEYNIWCDPEAAQIVFQSGMPIEMVGWELARGEAVISPDEIQAIYDMANNYAQFAMDCNARALRASTDWSKEAGLTLCDPVAMAVALDPDGVVRRKSKHKVQIETQGIYTRGMTVIDQLNVIGAPTSDPVFTTEWKDSPQHVEVVWEIDPVRWKEILRECLLEQV
jgi:purine nucleosidase